MRVFQNSNLQSALQIVYHFKIFVSLKLINYSHLDLCKTKHICQYIVKLLINYLMQSQITPGQQLRNMHTRDNFIKENHNDDEYIKQLQKNGIRYHKSLFPAFFQLKNGLMYPGMATKQLITQNQILVEVPEPLILSSIKALRQPALSEVFKEQFYKDANWEDRVLLTYCLYLLTIRQQGNIFYQMVKHLPKDIDVLLVWPQQQLDKFIDPTVKQAANLDKQSFQEEWNLFKQVQNKHQILQSPQVNKNNYRWIFVHIISRCFGKTMDATSFVPFCQYFNHHSSTVYYQINLPSNKQKELQNAKNKQQQQQLSSNGSNQSQQYIGSQDYAYDQVDPVTYKWGEHQSLDLQKQQKDKIKNTCANLFQRLQTQISWRDFSLMFACQFTNLVKIIENQYIQGRKNFSSTISKLESLQMTLEKYIQLVKQFYKNTKGKKYKYQITNRQNIQTKQSQVKQQQNIPNPQTHKTQYTHFQLKTGKRDKFLPNNQVYFCYGRNSNRNLLLHYGFTIQGNKYQHFWLIYLLSPILKQCPDIMQRVQKLGLPIRLKYRINYVSLNYEVIIFFRLFNWHLYDMNSLTQIFYITDFDQQITVIQNIIASLNSYLVAYQQQNQEDLEDKNLGYHEYFIKVYNIEKKKILLRQIELHEKILVLLTLLRDGKSLQQASKQLTSPEKYILRYYLKTIKV